MDYKRQWYEMGADIDLHQLAIQLEEFRAYLYQSEPSRSMHDQLGLVADAQGYAAKKDGAKVLEVLSKIRVGLLTVARDLGTDVAAKVIVMARHLRP